MNDYNEEINDVPDHVNDQNGTVSLFVLGMVVVLLVLLIIAIAQAM